MIHVLTIHWKSAEWIDIQLKYLKENLNQPFRVYAFLNDVPNVEEHKNKFFYYNTEDIKSHPIKLNLLADIAGFAAENDNDYLMFLDGDAFPINSLDDLFINTMENYPLAAVQRLENNDDIQPHPCFCGWKVSVWNGVCGDWAHGGITW
ncbi:MAG: hypothetical protein DWP95_06415 [Proteobacteria bacterium]|nr:MAG: hypothetical protein DWP95_06415 [Pseudomonadota bacterium]